MSTDDDDKLVERQTYLRAVEDFDRLWSCAPTHQDQAEMKRLLRIIEAYENRASYRLSCACT